MKKRKTILSIAGVLIVAAAFVLGGIKWQRIQERNQCGILLAFDDYAEYTWREAFDLFDQYGVKVTFFVNAASPTDFCFEALERGHEIGYHTKDHKNLREITEEEVYEQAVAPLEIFRNEGIDITSFAYPYGAYNEKLNETLLQYYNVLRGAYNCEMNIKHNLRKGFVESMPLDNGSFGSQEEYEEKITAILEALADSKGTVLSMYSHSIDAGGAWCISEEKLVFLFEKAKELGLKFYTFQELQRD